MAWASKARVKMPVPDPILLDILFKLLKGVMQEVKDKLDNIEWSFRLHRLKNEVQRNGLIRRPSSSRFRVRFPRNYS